MYKSLLCVFLLLMAVTYWPARAQTIVKGQVRTAQSAPLPGAVVEVQAPHRPEASAVAVADDHGQFSVELVWPDDSLVITVRALGFLEQAQRVRNRSQTVRFTLAVSLTPLKEVVVEAPPMRREGDTLSYRVSAFTEKKDRVIADVLRKLPGVEVEADGRILYEGQPIQKFYINGADLLESRYNLASNNLPAEAVQDVQVLKRHQPVQALRGVQATEQASLNISLKKQVTATGQARAGVGARPGLWNVNLAPMLFTPSQQLLDTYQTNNTGQDVAADLKQLGLEDLSQLTEPGNRKPDLTGIQRLDPPPLATGRWLFNRAHLLSANHLLPFSKTTQLRINASYLDDEQVQTGSTRTEYFLPEGRSVTLLEQKKNQLGLRQLAAELAFIRNEKQYYLKNRFSCAGSWDRQTGVVQPNNALAVVQQARNPFYTVSNRLGLVRPVGEKRLLQAQSVLTLAASPQQLAVQPGPLPAVLTDGNPYDQARQTARLGTFYTSNSVGLRLGRGRWGYTPTLGFTQEVQRLASALLLMPGSTTAPDTVRNQLRAYQARYYAQLTSSYKTDRTTLELELPLSYRTFSATDAALAAAQRRQLLTTEPRLSGRYQLSGLWHATASAGLRNEFGAIEQLYYGYLLRDYRTLQRNAAPLTQRIRWSYNAGLYFDNPLKMWLYHVAYSFTSTTANQLPRSLVRPDGTLTTIAVDQLSRSRTHSLSGSISKFISGWKLNLNLQLSGSTSRQPVLLNTVLASSHTTTRAARFRAILNAFSWVGLEYAANVTALRNQVDLAATAPVVVLQEHRASLVLYPAERHQVLLAGEHYQSQGPGPTVRNVFADATYRYTFPTTRKVDVEIKCSNLFAARQYQNAFVSDFGLVQNTYVLRPRQVLVAVRASF